MMDFLELSDSYDISIQVRLNPIPSSGLHFPFLSCRETTTIVEVQTRVTYKNRLSDQTTLLAYPISFTSGISSFDARDTMCPASVSTEPRCSLSLNRAVLGEYRAWLHVSAPRSMNYFDLGQPVLLKTLWTTTPTQPVLLARTFVYWKVIHEPKDAKIVLAG